MKEPALVILAAGLGSRFGGLKQITPIGSNGELIIDFSIYDAIGAGFKKIIFVIKKENEEDFEKLVSCKIRPFAEVRYAYQTMELLPAGFTIPEGREKPWGTGHATLCCKDQIDEPFAVINADDYYGRSAFKTLYDFLKNAQDDEKAHYAMVGYQLGNTLTENGFVSRGVCCENENHYLTKVTERTKIQRQGDVAVFTQDDEDHQLPLDTVVSMNMWAFTPSVLQSLEEQFCTFLKEQLPENPMKGEYFLPTAIDNMIQAGKADVTVLRSPDKWYGVTYRADQEKVTDAMEQMKADGTYPQNLWAER